MMMMLVTRSRIPAPRSRVNDRVVIAVRGDRPGRIHCRTAGRVARFSVQRVPEK